MRLPGKAGVDDVLYVLHTFIGGNSNLRHGRTMDPEGVCLRLPLSVWCP